MPAFVRLEKTHFREWPITSGNAGNCTRSKPPRQRSNGHRPHRTPPTLLRTHPCYLLINCFTPSCSAFLHSIPALPTRSAFDTGFLIPSPTTHSRLPPKKQRDREPQRGGQLSVLPAGPQPASSKLAAGD